MERVVARSRYPQPRKCLFRKRFSPYERLSQITESRAAEDVRSCELRRAAQRRERKFAGGPYPPAVGECGIVEPSLQTKTAHSGRSLNSFGSATGNRTRVLRLRISRPNP